VKRVLFVFGTRPEAIKLAPLIMAFNNADGFECLTCVTGQHRQMLDQVLDFFEIVPDFDLNLMKPNQSLEGLTAGVLECLADVLKASNPDYLFVHGDTTTSMAASLCAFYSKIKVCHVEAGLRTRDIYSPFPEELNRQITSRIAYLHFAPTVFAAENLISESIDNSSIKIVGNSVVDALMWTVDKLRTYESEELSKLKALISPGKRLVLVTGHRRENFGEGIQDICRAIITIVRRGDVQVIYPVHLNPNIQNPVYEMLRNEPDVCLIGPLSYPSFVWLMNTCALILTDSGGIQEEAPSLRKPVLVMREVTERLESLNSGLVRLVGTNAELICEGANYYLDQDRQLNDEIVNPFGDGTTSKRILSILSNIEDYV
jgi:UDP-N-acetylglucosamine 2-epimerase (non-hydrolysing)